MPGLHFFSTVFSIVLIDLVLSGDNAVVIGMAARHLPAANRRRAIILGGAGAIVLRIGFTILAVLLLEVPFLQAAGGVLLLWIAYKLVTPREEDHHVREASSLGQAVGTIIVADAVMSLDNILAVGGAAHGSIEYLIFGLLFSIPLLLLGSELVARLLGRFPVLVYVGAIVLVLTAVEMILDDEWVLDLYDASRPATLLLAGIIASVVILLAWRAQGTGEHSV